MAKVLIELGATGLLIGGLTFDFCKRVTDPSQDVNTGGATLAELGNGAYLLDVAVTEDTAFRVHVTADTADYAIGIFSNADGDLALDSTVAKEATLVTVLNRIGAITGSGINTVLGFFRALFRKDAALPSDIGGTADPATDSLEALSESLAKKAEPADFSGAVKAGTFQPQYLAAGESMEIARGDVKRLTLTAPEGWDFTGRKVFFCMKEDPAADNGTAKVNREAAVTGANTAEITLTASETDTVALYKAEWEQRDSDGTGNPMTVQQFDLKVIQDVRH
jgi:hypothetical protein